MSAEEYHSQITHKNGVGVKLEISDKDTNLG
jgi:hypothetical protein